MSNKSCLRWWINENIHDFIAPTYVCGDPLQPCTMRCEGHHPKVLLWIMEEVFYISHDLTDEDRNGHVVLGYELMIEAEHRYRIKWGGGIGCHWSPSHASSAPPCSPETLDCLTWTEPDSKTLECLVWSVYDGIITPGPTPKLVGPKSYNQVTRHLTTKVFRGLQVHCFVRTLVQFDEPSPPKVRLVILVPHQSKIARKTEAMHTASPKAEDAEKKGLWEVNCAWTLTNTQWAGCVTISSGTMMNRLNSGPCSAH